MSITTNNETKLQTITIHPLLTSNASKSLELFHVEDTLKNALPNNEMSSTATNYNAANDIKKVEMKLISFIKCQKIGTKYE